MSNGSSHTSCQPCGLHPFERNRYFDGKLLTTLDFQDEQDYLRGKSALHNHLLHGVGTVCGLKVTQHPNPACRHQFVILKPGLALDCCGHELVVESEQVLDIRALIEAALRENDLFPAQGAPDPVNVYLRLACLECEVKPVPALLDSCEGCNDDNTEFSRVAEKYRLLVDLQDPQSEAAEPLEARLEWQHTLSTAHPRAIWVDRNIERLYVAEFDGDQGWLRMYNASNHSLVVPPVALGAPLSVPTAMAASNLGDLIYVALEAENGLETRVVIFDQSVLETDPDNALVAVLAPVSGSQIIQLAVSSLDDSLYALVQDGRLMRWSSNALRDWAAGVGAEPAPVVQDLRNALPDPNTGSVAPVDMTINDNGRWMVVADSLAAQLIVLNLPQFEPAVPLGGDVTNLMKAHALPAADIPRQVEFSFDGDFLYVLCSASQTLYRIEVRDALDNFIPIIPAESEDFSAVLLADPANPNPPLPLDISVSPRDNWAYVLRRLFDEDGNPRDRGDVIILDVNAINEQRGPATAPLADPPNVDVAGNALFQNLAFLGQRLYVAGETPVEDGDPTQGSISILYIDEASCGAFIRRTIEGCDHCDDASHGVILASIRAYRWDEDIVDDEAFGPNVIDNFTHRPMVPSTNTLRQVIECMLEKGITEGIPGPRGAPGPQGEPGQQGDPGDPGPRGPGVTEAEVINTLPAGSPATANLVPIVGDPEGDFRLELEIPQGPAGPPAPLPEFNRVLNATFHLDEVMLIDEFVELAASVGFLAEFLNPVLVQTLHNRSAYLLVTHPEESGVVCECRLPMVVQPLENVTPEERPLRWLIGDAVTADSLSLLKDFTPLPAGAPEAKAVRLVADIDPAKAAQILRDQIRSQETTFTLVLRGAWILDPNQQGLDGDHLWPGVPVGPNASGVDGRLSGNHTEGGDFISPVHVRRQ